MARHGLACSARHRAMGDVELVVAYVELAKRELGEAAVLDAVARLMHGPSLPAGLDPGFLDDIPDSPGVYLFYGQNELPLYIGKSVALRSRVLSHFSGDHASAGICRSVRRSSGWNGSRPPGNSVHCCWKRG